MTREEEFNQWLKKQPEHFWERLTRVDELLIYQNRATARTEDLLRAIAAAGGLVIPPTPIEERPLILARAQFLSDPEGACSLINSHQPNLCRAAPIGIMTTLGPFATTTVTSQVPEGFACVMTRMEAYTDIPFAVQAIMLRDGVAWYMDTGVVPASTNFRNWQAAATQWDTILINTTALDVNVHLAVAGWQVEAQTYRNLMAALAPLSYATSEYGTPEGAPE